ncbi:YecR family lipoprotein [Arthrobacter sp.]|uniref:YecR family lipoprotein n=1 Tax=Arthrobacter sp. TaxID=1667 RepID=UPI00258B3A4E|nr:YecR family lipoprotein [Arthrobacter sp.]
MNKTIAIFGACALLSACATPVTMQAFGGSRSDGVVKLGFTYGAFEKPIVDQAAAHETAKSRCAVWGYKDAEPFGGAMQQCLASNQYGCVQMQVTVEYQCTGAKTPS